MGVSSCNETIRLIYTHTHIVIQTFWPHKHTHTRTYTRSILYIKHNSNTFNDGRFSEDSLKTTGGPSGISSCVFEDGRLLLEVVTPGVAALAVTLVSEVTFFKGCCLVKRGCVLIIWMGGIF